MIVDVTTISLYNRAVNYEWDERKRQVNIRKHGIDFIDAPEIFDGDVVVIPDERFDYGESRFIGVGVLKKSGRRGGLHGTRRQYPDHFCSKSNQK